VAAIRGCDFADDLVHGTDGEVGISTQPDEYMNYNLRLGYGKDLEESAYLLRRMSTESVPQFKVAWSPLTWEMVPSIRTVLCEEALGAKAWRWAGRIRGVDIDEVMVTISSSA
jgi:hypothetical protein